MAKKPAASSKKSSAAVAVAEAPPVPVPVSVVLPKNAARSAEQATVPTAPAPRPVPTHEEIAQRAYQLWTQGVPGGPADHWLQAESELRHT